MKHTLGFIGVGIMGCPMAIHLAEAGCKALVYENNKKAPVVAEHGAIPASLKQMAEDCGISAQSLYRRLRMRMDDVFEDEAMCRVMRGAGGL